MSVVEFTPLIYTELDLFRSFVLHSLVSPWLVILSSAHPHPLLCYVNLFSLSIVTRAHLFGSFISSSSGLTMHISYNITCDFPPLWYHCWPYDSLYLHSFHIFPASYLWKWQCYLQPPNSGFPDRENSGGDHLWRMVRWASIAYGFICKTSSALNVEKILASQLK